MPSFESRWTDPINLPKKIWVVMTQVMNPLSSALWKPKMSLCILRPKYGNIYVPYSYSHLNVQSSEHYKREHVAEFEKQLQDILGNWKPCDKLNDKDNLCQLQAIRDAFELQQAITHVKLSPTYIHIHDNMKYGAFSAASLQSDYIRII